jgi:glycosyltransferase involved in cell wall biosynthesis
MSTPTLSIVIPVYNEADWIGRCVADVAAALRNSPFADDAELVIVDDGSDQRTKDVLTSLTNEDRARVIEQPNRGRFAARKTGIEAAHGDLIMLLDSRVSLASDALSFIASQLNGNGKFVWNGHVDVEVEGNPYARFWRTITYASWREYLSNPRTTSFGLDDYDLYPKGTTCFLAPRESLLGALAEFDSMYEDSRHSNDDTVLIRSIAARQRINISPDFSCRYHSRDSLGRFLSHTFHRGTVFLDGFGRRGTRFYPVLVAFFPASLAFGAVAMRRPRLAATAAALVPAAAALYATYLRRPPRDVFAFSLLACPFAAAYAAGIWRGALLAVRNRPGERSPSPT